MGPSRNAKFIFLPCYKYKIHFKFILKKWVFNALDLCKEKLTLKVSTIANEGLASLHNL